MRVGIQFAFSDDSWIGGVNGIINLLHALRTLEKSQIDVVIVAGQKTPDSLLQDLSNFPVIRTALVDPGSRYYLLRRISKRLLGIDLLMERWLLRNDIDAFSHCDSLGRFSRTATIGQIADFSYLSFKDLYSDKFKRRQRGVRRFVHELDALLMPSKTVAEDYNRIFPKGRAIAAPLQIIPSAKPRHRCEAEVNETLNKYTLPKEFFYTPNQFWVHKNHGVIIEAMALLAAKGECPHVVSTGKQFDSRDPEYFSRLMRLAKERGVCDYFHVLGVIPYEDTVTLMQSCMAVVSSSRFEGWGLSVAEARILGKKVILTDIPVFREQNPARGLFYDPDDAVSLADHMLDVSRAYEPAKEAEECQKAAPDHAELVKAYARGYEDIVFLAASRKRGNQSPLSIVSPRMFRRPI